MTSSLTLYDDCTDFNNEYVTSSVILLVLSINSLKFNINELGFNSYDISCVLLFI